MKGPESMRNFQLPADQCVTAAGYLADAADCRARPISDTILDTWCRGITNLRPWPGLGLTAVRCQVVVVVSNEWPVSAA